MHTRPLGRRIVALVAMMALIGSLFGSDAGAHEGNNDGHIPSNVNYGFEPVAHDFLEGVTAGKYTDVWSLNGYAYIGTFQQPDCSDAGVFVVDMAQAVENYSNGVENGAVVAEIRSAPNTRINDVKAITIGDTDVLITTQEPCGDLIPGGATSDGSINKQCTMNANCQRLKNTGNGAPGQRGQGGISLYDVTDPTKPKALKKNYLEFGGVHNTFPWEWNGSTYLIGTADTFDFFDTFFVDITNPQSPRYLGVTGALDWIPQGLDLSQVETGSSGGIFNHDVWVEVIDGVPTAVVSYWDLGFVTLDVTNPSNPIFLGDSNYPDPDPISGLPYEGNAHAAVFGANGDLIFAGDEDFSPGSFGVTYDGVEYNAGQALFGPPPLGISGNVVWTGGEGCTPGEIPPAEGENDVALIQRGSCFFQDKGDSAEAQGYVGYIVANDEARGDALINMSARDDFPTSIPGVFVGYNTGEAMKAAPGLEISAGEIYDGWGYLHVLDTDTLEEVGYYAPAETVAAPELGTTFGDLTMHNIEADPLTADVTPTFDGGPRMYVSWYSLGMRALEYRPGHFHQNANGEGSYSLNVHEVGRWIDPNNGGSNFWGVHLDFLDVDGDGTEEQIILGSDRNTGLWIFTFNCGEVDGSPFYCQRGGVEPEG